MSYYILPISCQVISCVTVQRLTRAEQTLRVNQVRMNEFDQHENKALDPKSMDYNTLLTNAPPWNRLSLNNEDNDFLDDFNRTINDYSIAEADDFDDDGNHSPTQDNYLHMQLSLPHGKEDELMYGYVKRQVVDINGKPIGNHNNNPLLDTRQYEIEFMDGSTDVIAANVIAENLLSQVDEEGYQQLFLHDVSDHFMDTTAVTEDNAFTINSYGTKQQIRTTRGWHLYVNWKDGSAEWVALKDLKQAYPVELADYAVRNKIDHLPAFAWWVPYMIKKRNVIISKLKSKYWDRAHKYGIKIPKTVQEAYALDLSEGHNYWCTAIAEEMKKIRAAFDKYEGNPHDLIGYQEITTHIIFDVKLGENFCRKAQLVADGHKTQPPSLVTYSSVVTRDSVRICLLLAALNELDVLSGDIKNTYLTAPCQEKVWTRGGAEFVDEEGQTFIVVKVLYGLKSSGAAFRSHLAEKLDDIGFKSTIADPDVWRRAAIKLDGEAYYEYILTYVDDILCVSHSPREPLLEIHHDLKFKKDKIEPPDIYLGGRLKRQLLNGRSVWTLSSKDYIKDCC